MLSPDHSQPSVPGAAAAFGCLPHSLPPQSSAARFTMTVAGWDMAVPCPEGLSLLDAFERHRHPSRFTEAAPVQIGCRRGGCGICKVRITAGHYHSKVMSRAHVSETEEAAGMVLACCVYPESDLTLETVPVCPRRLK